MALSDLKVKNAKPKEVPYRLADSGGLHLCVTPSGGKLWRWKYRFNGKEKLMSFGPYPELSLADARAIHLEQRRKLVLGTDPMAGIGRHGQAAPVRAPSSAGSSD